VRALEKLGVELHMCSIVTQIGSGWLQVRERDGTEKRYEAATTLWTAGVAAPPIATALANAAGAKQDKAGRLLVNPDLTIPGHPEIAVVGDVMSLRQLPGVAEVAMQSGMYAGRRIRGMASGQPAARPFRYYDLGSAAYIARGNAVVKAGPVHLSGVLGWIAWLFIHLAFLTGFRNRLGAIVIWWPAFLRDLRRERAYMLHEVTPSDIYAHPELASFGPPPRPNKGQ
jgi:NADH dehydrogenase